MDGSALLGIFGGVLAVIALVASSVAVLFATRSKVVIENLRGDRDDQDKRITRLEGDVERLTAENKVLQSENSTLRSMKDATETVKQLAAVLGKADEARKIEHHDIIAAIQLIPVVFTAAHEETMKLISKTSHTHGGDS